MALRSLRSGVPPTWCALAPERFMQFKAAVALCGFELRGTAMHPDGKAWLCVANERDNPALVNVCSVYGLDVWIGASQDAYIPVMAACLDVETMRQCTIKEPE